MLLLLKLVFKLLRAEFLPTLHNDLIFGRILTLNMKTVNKSNLVHQIFFFIFFLKSFSHKKCFVPYHALTLKISSSPDPGLRRVAVTAQAPHPAWAQDTFVPVKPK